MEIYLYAGNLSKNKQKGDKYGLMETSGRDRKTWGHLGPLTDPTRAPLVPPCATLALSMSPIHGSCSISSPMHWFKSVCINGHDGMVLDAWVHYHGLGAPQLTSKPLYLQISTCVYFTTTFGSQPRLYNQKVVKSRADRRPYHAAQCPSVAPLPLLRTHTRKHTWEQHGILIYGGSRSVTSKGGEGWSRGSLTWR
jgi:hypothetical protein